MRCFETLALGCLLCCSTAAVAQNLAHYSVDATVTNRPAEVRGQVSIRFTNAAEARLDQAILLLFPNRFALPDAEVNDFNRPFVYPEQEFHPGRISVDVWDGEDLTRPALAQQSITAPNVCTDCAIQVRLDPPLAPGASRTLTVRFDTKVPYRFGSFGIFDEQLTLAGGWHPLLAQLDAEGWHVDAPPPAAQFDVRLALPQPLDVVLNGKEFPAATKVERHTSANFLTLVAAPHFERRETVRGHTHIVLLYPPPRHVSRVSPEAEPAERLLATVAHAVEDVPAPLTAPSELLVVQAPLRLRFLAPSQGMVVVTDRALKVFPLLRPFHERQLAQAIYAEWLRGDAAWRDGRDAVWVNEAVAHHFADRFMASQPPSRSVHDWVELFNTFAVVDRFETSPKVPFVETFFHRRPIDDVLHEQIDTFNNALPPGHVILDKLRPSLGEAGMAKLTDAYAADAVPLRALLQQICGEGCLRDLQQWVQPHPTINYAISDVDFNQPGPEGYRHQFTVRRESSRAVVEPVEISIRSIGGEIKRMRWDGRQSTATLQADTKQRVYRIALDPDYDLIETTRADNARHRELQAVIDSAEVEVSSTEFGFAVLGVARARYDYEKDIAAAGVYSNRSIGTAIGPRWHWGTKNDPNTYRNNLFGFYSAQALDHSFNDKRHPEVRTTGHSNGFGLRYDYSDIYGYDNPTSSLHCRLFGDWYDEAIGSDYNYVDAGGGVSITRPVFTPRTIFAAEVFNGFTQPLGSGRVPLQGQFSLGGSRSIRGIGAEEEIGRNIFLLRAELRRSLYPEVDFNMLDVAVLRRFMLRGFVDAGQVRNSAGAVYDPRGYAVGVGLGLGYTYDFLGFFPAQAYIEVATRVDRSEDLDNIQVLFGSRQPF